MLSSIQVLSIVARKIFDFSSLSTVPTEVRQLQLGLKQLKSCGYIGTLKLVLGWKVLIGSCLISVCVSAVIFKGAMSRWYLVIIAAFGLTSSD